MSAAYPRLHEPGAYLGACHDPKVSEPLQPKGSGDYRDSPWLHHP